MTTEDDLEAIRAERERLEDEADRMNPADRVEPLVRERDLVPMAGRARGRLAIVVGHTKQAPGAFGIAPIGMSEYPWNTDLAAQCQVIAEAENIDSAVFFRDGIGISGAYAAAVRWAPNAIVELHFNADGGRARGSEVLHGTQAGSSDYAARMQASFVRLYGRSRADGTDRGLLKRLPGSSARGALNVNSAPQPSILIEPFFGDNGEDAGKGQRLKGDLARMIVGTFVEFRSAAGRPPDA